MAEHAGGIAIEQRNLESRIHQSLAERVDVILVVTKEAVFVFHLHHQDRAALGDLEWREHAADLLEVALRGFEVFRIGRAQVDGRVFQEPPRGAAHFPLGAGVRAGPEQHPQAFLLREPAELRDVRLAAPVELAFARLVHVPEQIGANRVQPHRLAHFQAMRPILAGHARGVDLAAADLQALAAEQEIRIADGEGVRRAGFPQRLGCGSLRLRA